jgi:hypothetical protein
MTRQLVATVVLLAVFVMPLGALWCAYACAVDDDSVTTVPMSATAWASPLPDSVAGRAVFATHDDCPADLTNTAILATFEGRVRHTVALVVSLLAVPTRMSVLPASLAHSVGPPKSPGSPPGGRSSSVLRI